MTVEVADHDWEFCSIVPGEGTHMSLWKCRDCGVRFGEWFDVGKDGNVVQIRPPVVRAPSCDPEPESESEGDE